ncbi:hypothetical protein SAMN05428947_104373 [Mucilaginibacter sp. OK283]|nr:hypothetical protein SAMN05428947_104373 [Mucilaginibacter sp. OK283]
MRRKDDILWKGILEDVFDDFLCFLNPDASKFSTLIKVSNSWIRSWNRFFRPKMMSILQR